MDKIKELLTPIVKQQMTEELEVTQNPIFIFVGMEQYIDIDAFAANIVDHETFGINGNDEIFSQEWFTKIFTAITLATTLPDKEYTILSFPQFSYLVSYISPEFFKDRIIVVRDGLRSLLPLNSEDFLEQAGGENIEERNPRMPNYMAEHVKIGNDCYYSIQVPMEEYMTLNIFTERISLEFMNASKNYEVIDTVSDPHGIDTFLNRCLAKRDLSQKVIVKFFKKQPMKDTARGELERVNWLLSQFGGKLYELDESAIDEEFKPREETSNLLKEYWGTNAGFRNLKVYKNPDYGKEIISISQGLIVETIINEYENAKKGENVKDLFLTAPTGAGKSLLFQLPAFYVSAHNDVTIVVSPLIALMKDQVEQIRNERDYKKVFYLNSELSLIDRERVIEDCKNGEVDILYLSPELLLSYEISYFIGDRNLGLLVIDEAHLITTWGRDFRVDYWFLGQHINKIRKLHDYRFPMVAVTATAIYGGDNDMVFDSVNSLYMHDPHIFIGEVKRSDITFVIDNHDRFKSNYDSEKEKETVQFIKNINDADIKTIVYAPYRMHIDNIMQRLETDGVPNIAVAYHSGLIVDEKNLAYENFRTNKAKVMVSTKAFGMGVDISDIQLVYHHAPSGLLPDYVQEIGRAARNPEINGFAAVSYAMEDQRYSKALHGMSALRHYQIREVLNKINKTFIANKKKRNMLVAAEDFSYIFDDAIDFDQKVMTALMMIEKDYLAKYRFNVLIARPKKLFVKVYSRVNNYGLSVLKRKHKDNFRYICKQTDDKHVVELDLDEIWKKHFSDRSFPMIKKDFYDGRLFQADGIETKAQVKISFTLDKDFDVVIANFSRLLDCLQGCFTRLQGHYFGKEELAESISAYIPEKTRRDKIVNFILSSYSGRALSYNEIDGDAFLQRRHDMKQEEAYRVFNNKYANNFAKLKRRLQRLYENSSDREAFRFASYGGEYLLNYVRLGSLLEILGLGTYESRGGDNPMIFIRINDPRRIARDAANSSYRNSLLTTIESRHRTSTEIFDHFFLHAFENEDRWNFIEDYFLGESPDELLQKYPGGERNHINIVDFVKRNAKRIASRNNEDSKSKEKQNLFAPREKGSYSGENLLNIDGKVQKISRWLIDDPVSLDKIRRKYKMSISSDIFSVLMSKLRTDHFTYYRDTLGLDIAIDFPNFQPGVKARFVYESEPIKFYKWWCKNDDKVYLKKVEQLKLFIKVNELNPKALLKKHREILINKKF